MSTIETRRQLEHAQPEQTGSAQSSAHRATTFSWERAGECREERRQESTTGFRSFERRIWNSHKQPDRLLQTAQGFLTGEGAAGSSNTLRPIGAPAQFLAEAWQTCNLLLLGMSR